MTEKDLEKNGIIAILRLLERISWTDSAIRKLQRSREDGDFIIDIRECALQDWRFVWTMCSCPQGCLHEHGEEWKERLKEAIERIGEHRDTIHTWLKDRSDNKGDTAYPSLCHHGTLINA